MAKGVVRLLFSLVGEDKLSGAIEKSRASLEEFAGTTEKQGKKTGSAFATLEGTISGMPGKLTDLNAGFEMFGGLIDQISQGIDELAEAEKRVNARRLFEMMQGDTESAAESMEELEKASAAALKTDELIKFSNAMRLAGQEQKTTAEVLAIASTISQQTGEGTLQIAEQLKDTLITGSETGMELLGVTIDLQKGIEEQAAAMGKTKEEMNTAEKAEIRLAVASEALKDRMAVLGIDTGKLGLRFQTFKKDIEDTKEAMAEMAAEALGETQREAEVKQLHSAIQDLGKEYTDQLNKGHSNKFVSAVVAATGLQKDLIKGQVFELEKMGVVTGSKLKVFANNLVKVQDEAAKAERETRKKAVEEREQLEKDADLQRRNAIATETENLMRLEAEKTEATRVANDALIADLDRGIAQAGVRMRVAQQEITALQGKAELARMEAEEDRTLLDEFIAEAEDLAKQAEDRSKANKTRAKKRRAERDQEERADAEARKQSFEIIKNENIKKLIEEGDFLTARNQAHILADNDLSRSDREMAEISEAQRELFDLQRLQKQQEINTEFDQLEKDHLAEQERIKDENRAKKEEREQQHLDKMSEMRELALEDERKRAERLSQFSSAISQDLRRYDEETAIIMQGHSDIQSALAQNAGNVGKQAAASIQAGGKMTESLIKDTKSAALTRAAFETAAGFASIAGGDVVGGGLHFTAAALFGAMAGGSGKSKGGRKAATNTSLTRGGGGSGPTGFGSSGGANQVTVNVAGFLTGTAKDLGVQVANTVDGVESTGLSTASV